jgi:Fe-S-cluster containining protein
MNEIKLRDCGECQKCCEGHLLGKAYGNHFGNGRKCIFLVKQDCTIYKDRPETCMKYQCAWSQSLLPESERPDKHGLMVSVEWDGTKQYFKVMELKPVVENTAYRTIEEFCTQNNTYYVKVPYVYQKN